MRRSWACWLLLPLLAACTRDFSAFGFDDADESQRDPVRTPDASDTARPDAGGDAAAPRAGDGDESTPASAGAGGSPNAAPAASGTAPNPDRPQDPAGQVDSTDAGADDAGGIDSHAPECAASWNELSLPMPEGAPISDASGPARSVPPTDQCQTCACDACASAILSCLHEGSSVARGLCRDVLGCALRERCQEYDCYCSSMGCGFPGGIGDGPCAAEINAAAGGNRSRVIALRNAVPQDRNQPLVRAMQAIACVLGEHPSSARATISGSCNAPCQ